MDQHVLPLEGSPKNTYACVVVGPHFFSETEPEPETETATATATETKDRTETESETEI